MITKNQLTIPVRGGSLVAELSIPANVGSLILFATTYSSRRAGTRNGYLAKLLNSSGFATVLVDLLTTSEQRKDVLSGEYRFDIDLLSDRLVCVAEALMDIPDIRYWDLGCFGNSTGTPAALTAAAEFPKGIQAIVSRGGRPDLAANVLRAVEAPTLFIVGANDDVVLEINRHALLEMQCPRHLVVIPGAGHIFSEPGALDTVADQSIGWFSRYLTWISPFASGF